MGLGEEWKELLGDKFNMFHKGSSILEQLVSLSSCISDYCFVGDVGKDILKGQLGLRDYNTIEMLVGEEKVDRLIDSLRKDGYSSKKIINKDGLYVAIVSRIKKDTNTRDKDVVIYSKIECRYYIKTINFNDIAYNVRVGTLDVIKELDKKASSLI